MTTRIVSSLLAAVLVLNAMVAAWLWYPGPADTRLALLVIFILPFSWGVAWLGAGRSGEETTRGHYDVVTRWILLAATIFLIALLRSVATRLGLIDDPDLWRRGVFVLWGVFLMVMGNRMPKMLMPLGTPDEPRLQSLRRLMGWTFVALGVTTVILFLSLPLEVAKSIGHPLVLGTLAASIAARAVWLRGPRSGSPPAAEA